MTTLHDKALHEAVSAVSASGTFAFTARNVYYELVRRGAWAAPTRAPREELLSFRHALDQYENKHQRIGGLIRAHEARAAVPPPHAPDVFDYSVRRVLVFDRVETFLLFAVNGFHRKIEVALLACDATRDDASFFPAHVARRLERQLEGGLRTAFYLVHDANRRGRKLRSRTRSHLIEHGKPRIADVGLTFAQAFQLGIPVRTGAEKRVETRGPEALEEDLLLASGNYAHLEDMPPMPLMRWAHERVSRGAEELGFG